MYKSQNKFFMKQLSDKKFLVLLLLFLLCVIIACVAWTKRNSTKVELSNFTTYTFEELYKTNEFVGMDVFYNNNVADLKDTYVTTFELNFKNKNFEYLDYAYLFLDDGDLLEQKVDITRQGELLFLRKEQFRLQIDYKRLLTLHQIKEMLLILESSDWMDFFNVSNEDNVEFKYMGLIEKNEENFGRSKVYVIKENKIEKGDRDRNLDERQKDHLWTIRINNEIDYVYISL